MRLLKRIFVALLILSVTNLYLPKITFAKQHQLFAKAGITGHKPEILSTPEDDIPVEVVKKKSYTWLWVVVGALAVGVAAAGGKEKTDEPPPEGDVTVTW